MATSKTPDFPEALAEAAWLAKALSHPARLAILQTLAQQGTCICGEIVEVLPLAQATVSQHLKALREAGLVRGETDGPRSCYCAIRTRSNAPRQLLPCSSLPSSRCPPARMAAAANSRLIPCWMII